MHTPTHASTFNNVDSDIDDEVKATWSSKLDTQTLESHTASLSSPTSRLYAQVAAGQLTDLAQIDKPTITAAQAPLGVKPTRVASSPSHATPYTGGQLAHPPNAGTPLGSPNAPAAGKSPALARPPNGAAAPLSPASGPRAGKAPPLVRPPNAAAPLNAPNAPASAETPTLARHPRLLPLSAKPGRGRRL